MLKLRVLSAVLLLPVVLALFIWGPAWLVLAFIVLCAALSVREAVAMLISAFSEHLNRHRAPLITTPTPTQLLGSERLLLWIVTIVGALLVFGCGVSGLAGDKGLVMFVLLAAFVVGTLAAPTIELKAGYSFAMLIALTIGALPWIMVWDLYELGAGGRYVVLLMAVAWSGDTGGYFGGRFLGGKLFKARKMAPVISPNKTWEGAVAGLLMSVVGAGAVNHFYGGSLASWPVVALCGLCGGIFEQLGDLSESSMKRFASVKDSGTLIPGHGGFLDRVDGILFAAPVIWMILYCFS